MNKKIIVTISAIIIYATLYGCFFKVFKDKSDCASYSLCLRFCSDDKLTFSDQELLNEFLKSKSGSEWDDSDRKDFKVFRGMPACGEMKFVAPNKNVTKYRPPYDFHYRASIVIDGERYDFKRYCLEKSDFVEDGWKLMICQQDYFYYKLFHLILISISILIFGLILFVYSYFKELRDFYGKFTIGFMVSQIIAYAIVPLILFNNNNRGMRGLFGIIVPVLFGGSMLMTLLWITVMIVHSFLTFKNFKNQPSKPNDFLIYAVFVITFMIFSACILAFERISYNSGLKYLFLSYCFIGFLDIFLMIVIGIKVFILSRHISHSEQPLFDIETKWYWITVKLSLIMLATWPFVMLSCSNNRFDLLISLSSDFVIILTAIMISVILLGRKQVRILIFGKYRGILNVES
ncbi:hypothetical protein ACKWTF_008968 [Chironomus riparius]